MENIQDIYPLSPMQQGMLFHTLYDPQSANYTEQMSGLLNGTLDSAAFRRAWQEVLNRHDILRTAFVWEGVDEPLQVVHEQLDLPFELTDHGHLNDSDFSRVWDDRRLAEQQRGFALTDAPLLRIVLLRQNPLKHAFIFTYHHILLDGWAMPLVLGEVFKLYDAYSRNQSVNLPHPLPFKNYIAWLQEQDLSAALNFWKQRLQGFYSTTALVIDHQASRAEAPYLKKRFAVPAEVSDRLHDLVRSEKITLNTILQGALGLLLAIYNRTDDIVFGGTVSGRPTEVSGIETMVGLFINTLPVRVQIKPGEKSIDLLKRLHGEQAEARHFEFTPLVDLRRVSELSNDQELFDVLFVFENYPVDESVRQQPSVLTISDLRVFERSNYPLTVVASAGNPIHFDMAFDTARISEAAIERMAGHLISILESFAADAAQPAERIFLLPAPERQTILGQWNETSRVFSGPMDIVTAFEEMVRTYPQYTALVSAGQSTTYNELNQTVNRLAGYLRQKGLKPGQIAAICTERDSGMIIATLAVLKCGAVYLPIDASYPDDRIRYMLEDSAAQMVITSSALSARFDNPLIPEQTDLSSFSAENPGLNPLPGQAAYIIYTSGSTGNPKGVVLHHGGLLNTIRALQQDFGITAGSRGLQFASFSFDAAVAEIFAVLLAGGSLYTIQREQILSKTELARFLNENQISFLTFPPSLLAVLEDEDFPALKTVASVGEACPKRLAEIWRHKVRFINGYGPTEATIGCIWGVIDRDYPETTTVPIGRPIYNDQIYILDQRLNPLPVGVAGELCIASPGLAFGYLNRPDLTAERFIPNPYASRPGERIYRSGDLARWLSDGTLEFIGRIDFQVKIRGNRIELGEIEGALCSHPDVKEAVVLAVGDDPATKRLAAWLVTRPTDLDLPELRRFLSEKLPDYMQPSAFTVMEAFPLTSNGKVNRRALPDPVFEQENRSDEILTPLQELLVSIWRDVLGIENISIHDNFFHLGGHSLLATQLTSRIREAIEVEIPLRDLFGDPTIAWLSQYIAQQQAMEKGFVIEPLQAGPRPERIPLSFAQQRLWFLDQLQPGGSFYNIPTAVRLSGSLDTDHLSHSIRLLIERHEILRTTFGDDHGQPFQIIDEAPLQTLQITDLSNLPEDQREARAVEIAGSESLTAFDLKNGPLFRPILLRLTDTEHILLLTMHHIISDGWSMGVLTREIAALYQALQSGNRNPLPVLEVQYADYAIWQRGWLKDEVLRTQLKFWEEQLGFNPPPLQLPVDFPRPAVQTFNGQTLSCRLDSDQTELVRRFSRQHSATTFMTLISVFQTLLHRYSGQSDILVGSPIANRTRRETENLIGFFVNSIVIRAHFEPGLDFLSLVQQVRERTIGAYAHQDIPFEQLVDHLQTNRDMSHSPLFQVMFVMQNLPGGEADLPNLTLRSAERPGQSSKFDLTLIAREGSQGIMLDFEFNTDLFSAATIQRLQDHYLYLLESVLSEPELPLDYAGFIPAGERELLTTAWNKSQADFESSRTAVEIFEKQTLAHPQDPAIRMHGQSMDYETLNRRANQLARHLLSLGIGPEKIVGISMERAPEMMVSILAVLKAGAAFLPLDPAYPAERLKYMIEDSGTDLILTQQFIVDHLPLVTARKIAVDQISAELSGLPAENLNFPLSVLNSGYIIYTSGSTGQPKGTVLLHQGMVNLANEQRKAFDIKPGKRILQFSSLSFDASVWETVMALLNGAALVLVPRQLLASGEALTEVIASEQISTITLPPSVLAVFPEKALPGLETIITAGEKCPIELVKKWQPGRRFYNAYGPTETTVCASMYLTDAQSDMAPPIGRAIGNFKLYVLDAQRQLCPIGVPGELCIGGVGLARGYLNRPELTSEKFIPDAFSGASGGRLYRSGDLVRWNSEGQIEFLGRIDQQVKVRGFRIELGEIESALARTAALRDVAVVAREDQSEKRLVAYLVSDAEEKPDLHQLRQKLLTSLPEYMVPTAYVFLDEMPLTPNGKIDRRALPAPEAGSAALRREYVAPRNETEERICSIISELLHIEQVGVLDNFFELGGHSLLATQFMSRLREQLQVELALIKLFEKPVVEQLALAVLEAQQSGLSAARPQIQKIDRSTRRVSRSNIGG